LPWGSHICLFYETAQDLIEVHAGYLGAGVEDGEFCVWALSDPLNRHEAIEGLRGAFSGFERHYETHRIELLPGYEWYLQGDEFDPQRITGGWHAKLDSALARGFAGMRVSGNAFWLEADLWSAFREYEAELNRALTGRRMIVLCTYSLQASRAVDILEVAGAHDFSIVRRHGRWELLDTPALAQAERELGMRETGGTYSNASPNAFPGHDQLTLRERVVLAQITKGASSKEAARTLGISPRTVEFHRANMMRKLGARNVAELLSKVLGAG
jgi:DNA-binding CsgD family transcriptional regulator